MQVLHNLKRYILYNLITLLCNQVVFKCTNITCPQIFIKFHLAYEDEQGRVVTEFKAIALHYLKDPTGFALDVAAVFPYELIGACIPQNNIRTAAVLYLRLPHVIRVIRIQWFFSTEEKRLNQKYA